MGAQAQIASLETQLAAAETAKLEAAALHEGLRAQLAASEREAEALRGQLKRQANAVRHAQNIAKEVLAERSEAQAFLVSSIRMVRRQIAQEQEAQEKAAQLKAARERRAATRRVARETKLAATSANSSQATPASASLPASAAASTSACAPASPCRSTSSASSGTSRSSALAAAASVHARISGAGGRLADIGELSWEEREAILRLLLAQINNNAGVEAAQSAFALDLPASQGSMHAEHAARLALGDAMQLATGSGGSPAVPPVLDLDENWPLPELGSPNAVPFQGLLM